MKTSSVILAGLLTLCSFSALAAPQHASHSTSRLGFLSCDIDAGVGYIFGSSKGMHCVFRHNNGATEDYSGRLSKFGLDIGMTGKSHLKWMVVTTASHKLGDAVLNGQYNGVSVSGAVGLGLGMHALIGGSHKQIGLQPFSASASTGLNAAAAVTSLSLKAVR